MSAPVIRSPCVGICDLDADGLCRGCRRTLDEVAAWIAYTDAERDAIIADLDLRIRSPKRTNEPSS
jgi:predicted Fe-S protein YdhL (DUF1289 family)